METGVSRPLWRRTQRPESALRILGGLVALTISAWRTVAWLKCGKRLVAELAGGLASVWWLG